MEWDDGVSLGDERTSSMMEEKGEKYRGEVREIGRNQHNQVALRAGKTVAKKSRGKATQEKKYWSRELQ